ncbi:hypothetical protein [Gelidibacter salicanalis]|uniref:Uncharacterized protein n=1 Tax=Gelidibacter salicanalis TaxID=291193 RepID=A0A934NBN4_9FLAO|nr:hypothetical protein [Gelidibacter salicanalis]MBJ7879825.1 hypothetical protein [Gelidibacter salicanalis]
MKLLTDRNLTLINFGIVFYFLIIYGLYVFKIDFVIIGVFQEMLSIPFLIAQVVFVVIGINYVIKHKKKPLTIISLFALIVCSILTIGSFF